MKVIVARGSGFCFGVKRALEIVEKALREERGPFYTLGPLIHNPQVVEKLSQKGLKIIDNLKGIKEGTFIIRSHGLPRATIELARKKGLRIIDATCPYVKRAQERARELEAGGYQLVIVGDRDHPEVKSMASEKSIILQRPSQVEKIESYPRMGVVAQTTQSLENFKGVVKRLGKKAEELKVCATICSAVSRQQRSTRKLAKQADLVLIIGGRNSANTKRLFQISKGFTETHHIERLSEIDPSWLKNKKMVGISAGASTPKWLINEVAREVKGL
ncbi:4-hydroxy-3-methylbut-2-enyl diphosphate reductase [bacterium]|nr:4-hydroxy-3-methylbut-2-enyl diphosphate reductase [bacterium]MBU4561678.1 4-hydroxy-3-methylbut-2-enyl diphosphate reductase [bacterium]MCG2675800.1 4-hydroxy-3-methylbut-2-enyl diphosphate reductase [bacterium]